MSEKEKPKLELSYEDASDVYGLIVDAETTYEQQIYDYENKLDPNNNQGDLQRRSGRAEGLPTIG